MLAAQAHGAAKLTWEDPQERNGFIKRVDLKDPRLMAGFLGQTPLSDVLAEIAEKFEQHYGRFPVLGDVLERWSQLRTVRSLTPASVQDWLDAVQVIDAAGDALHDEIVMPIREKSYRIFKDSKRIEKLATPVDVLLSASVETPPREPAAVWAELGLFREEHPALLAGEVIVKRERVTAVLDAPYSGLPAVTVTGLGSVPRQVMTIENLTTFHSEARRRHTEEVLLIYTAGMPSPAWRDMYGRILKDLPDNVPIFHWGDVDAGGFRIAAALGAVACEAGHKIQPWKMHPDDVPEEARKKATPYVLERIQHFATAAGWHALGDAVATAGFTVEQEGLA